MLSSPRLLFRKFFKRPDYFVDGVASAAKVGRLYGRGMDQLFRAFDEASEGALLVGPSAVFGCDLLKLVPSLLRHAKAEITQRRAQMLFH